MAEGRCLCGALHYSVEGPYTSMMNCHCSMCRKHHGAAFATFVTAPIEQFKWISGGANVGTYQSSETGSRAFCKVCGSVAPAAAPEYGIVFVPAGNLEGELGATPQAHIFAGSKAPWHSITDEVPQFDEDPPEFGGTPIARPPLEPQTPGVVRGSCLCGDVAFEARGAPLRMFYCHCSRCRRGRSAAHGANVFYPLDAFTWLRGESQIAEFKVPDAQFFAVAFCRRCGSDVPYVSAERKVVVIPAGTLDDDPGMRSMAHLFVGSKSSWYQITDSAPQYDAYPPSR
jgi:hypothetical protein